MKVAAGLRGMKRSAQVEAAGRVAAVMNDGGAQCARFFQILPTIV